MTEAVIVDAIRTPLGKRNGKLKDWHPVDLAATTLTALQERNDLDPARRRRRVRLRDAGRRAGDQRRPQRRARRRLARVGARHHGRPAVRLEPAGAALRRPGRDGRRLRRRRRRRCRGDDPVPMGSSMADGKYGYPFPQVGATGTPRTAAWSRRASPPS
jgi:acetyl-CoA acyltransferase